MPPRCSARPASWLFLLVILADSSWDSSLPQLPHRLRSWAMAKCSLRHTWAVGGRRRTRQRPAGFASAAEPDDEPPVEPRYCPTESRFKSKQTLEHHISNETSCERLLMKVKNSSGVTMNVFMVNSDGHEVLKLTVDPHQAFVVAACRGQLWRARASSSGAPGRRRLLSETRPQPLPGDSGTDQMKNAPGDAFLWEVLDCVGYPLPKSFDVSSSLGGLGKLHLSREKSPTEHPSADIEGLVSVTLEEAFRGKDVSVTVQRRVPCPVCHGFGAASFVSCDRCGGSGKRLHEVFLTNADDAPVSDSCRVHCHGMGTAKAENTDVVQACGGNSKNNSSGPHLERHCTGGGGYVGGGNCSLGQNTNNRCNETLRKEEAAADDANVKGGANDGGLKLSHSSDCAKCKGAGRIPAPRTEGGQGYCTRCAGAGYVEVETELVLSIPVGVEKGQTEVYEGKGHVDLADLVDSLRRNVVNQQASAAGESDGKARRGPSPAPAPSPIPPTANSEPSTSSKGFFTPPRKKNIKIGNFRLTVDVLPHPVFSRGDDGADLFTSIAISLEEALAGFTRDIAALDGSVVTLRRTSRTLPGMVLRFPGLGMPTPLPADVRGTSTHAEDVKPMSPSAEDAATAPKADVIRAVSRATMDAVADRGQWGDGDDVGPAGKNMAFGDLFVEASVTLPPGMRDDRSKFIGEVLKSGSNEAKEEEERDENEKGGGEWRGTRRGWRRRERRRRAEAEATVDGVQEE